ncbi:MAG: SAM-dependent chlorinase/fluorinase [Deltaproteobacteria bacterium]|nr:SAM-dependent chlorinase/fluorinase [Deltaproteobacteria bacterium]
MDNRVSGLITLVTDFGLSEPYAGIMKGVILSLNPSARIVDITHQIGPFDIFGAANVIGSSFSYFPSGTIHMVVVDPTVGCSRRVVAVRACGHVFLAPDNGVLSRIVENEKNMSGVWVKNRDWFLHPVSNTFHGRDIFAPVAAYLSMGRDLADLGPRLNPKSIFLLPPDLPERTKSNGLAGRVVGVDSFGNLVTNISADVFLATFGNVPEKNVVIHLAGHIIKGISKTYGMKAENVPLALFGSAGFLEISVNLGNAADYFKAGVGSDVVVDAVA